MLKHYLTMALRTLRRNRLYTLINILGLSLGMACTLMITLFVQHEWAYDTVHEKRDRIYRLSNEMELGGTKDHYALTGMAVAPGMAEAYPEVENYARILYSSNPTTVQVGDRIFEESGIYMADSQVFDVFTIKLLDGDAKRALTKPRTLVLNKSLADKLFPGEDALGQSLKLNGNDYEVSGVMADLPGNVDLEIRGMIALSTFPAQARQAFERDWAVWPFTVTCCLNSRLIWPISIRKCEPSPRRM